MKYTCCASWSSSTFDHAVDSGESLSVRAMATAATSLLCGRIALPVRLIQALSSQMSREHSAHPVGIR